jgi:hypothetical protein
MSGLLNRKVSKISFPTNFGFPDVPIVMPSKIRRSKRKNRLPAHGEKTSPLWLRRSVRRASSVIRARVVGKQGCVIETKGPTQQLVAPDLEGDN